VPASNAGMIEKAATLDADEIVLDLEDACAPSKKEAAREAVVAALTSLDFGRSTRAVRINDLATPWARDDIARVVGGAIGALDVLVVPKVESADQVALLDELLPDVELETELLIESARAAVDLREIARASTRLGALIFGPGDYAASLGIPQHELGASDPRYLGHQWHWIMSEIVVNARAVGAQAVDGPLGDFRDEQRFRHSALQARLLGFDGKWCIHPSQVEWANDIFSPTPAELETATGIVAAYHEALSRGDGAIAIDGKMVDEASRKLAEATIERGRAAAIRSDRSSQPR
jgi:citrate lyase beta subunit